MPDNDPFDYTIDPPEDADGGHVRIVARSTFDPTEPSTATEAEVREGLRQVAGMLARLAVHHFDGHSSWHRTHPVIAAERIAHSCGTHCAVTAAGLVDPYAVLRADADPFGPLAVAPTVAFTVPASNADAWRAALRDTLRRIARVDGWTPTDRQRRLRMMVGGRNGVGCAPNAIDFEAVNGCDSHWHFGLYTPDVDPLYSDFGSETGTLHTVAAVYAGRREASCRMARAAAEMIEELDRAQVRHGCKPTATGDGCTVYGSALLEPIHLEEPDGVDNADPSGVVFRAPTEMHAEVVQAAARALLAEVDAADAPPVAARAKR